MKNLFTLNILLLFFLPAVCSGGGQSDVFMRAFERGEIFYYDIKTSQERSRINYTLERIPEKDKMLYKLNIDGNGSYGNLQNITWRQESLMEEKNGMLFILYTAYKANNKKGSTVASYEKIFNYKNKKIYWRSKNPDGSVHKEIVFPLKGKTTDDISMIYFLKAFAARHNEAGFQEFYLITNEPRMYKTKIKFLGEEKLPLPSAEKKAIKLKLTGDVGIIDDILDRYIPHTYIWYEAEQPFDWLQYEGFETNMRSAYVRAYIVKRESSP